MIDFGEKNIPHLGPIIFENKWDRDNPCFSAERGGHWDQDQPYNEDPM